MFHATGQEAWSVPVSYLSLVLGGGCCACHNLTLKGFHNGSMIFMQYEWQCSAFKLWSMHRTMYTTDQSAAEADVYRCNVALLDSALFCMSASVLKHCRTTVRLLDVLGFLVSPFCSQYCKQQETGECTKYLCNFKTCSLTPCPCNALL